MRHTAITAHSGCEGTLRDSFEGIERGIALGAECVEVDVQMDAAGMLRLSHDARADYSGAETLEKAFARIADAGISVNCDLKAPRVIYPVLEMAKRYGLTGGQLIFSGSVSCDLLAADPEISRQARVFLNGEEIAKYFYSGEAEDFAQALRSPWSILHERYAEILDDRIPQIAAAAKSVGAAAINLPFRNLTHEHIARFRACGAELSLWTVNEEEDMRRLLREDLISMTTLNVRRAMEVRAEIQK